MIIPSSEFEPFDLLKFNINNSNQNEKSHIFNSNELLNQDNLIEDEFLRPDPIIRITQRIISDTFDINKLKENEIIDSKNIEFPDTFFEMSPKEIEDVLGINIDYSKIDFEIFLKAFRIIYYLMLLQTKNDLNLFRIEAKIR